MVIENIDQAVDFIYKSYLKANKHHKYDDLDKYKRTPEFTSFILDKLELSYTPTNILITGSKGKGSVAIMLATILQLTNDKVGLFTSPHIEKFNERIRINKNLINDLDFIEYVKIIEPYINEIDSKYPINKYVSPIGILVLIALLHFHKKKTNVNVFECGKGVRYDDVNQINREYSIINPIFLEHTRELGKTILEIADDKSCIIKRGQRAAYTASQDNQVLNILREKASAENVKLLEYGSDFYAENIELSVSGTTFNVKTTNNYYSCIRIPLLGIHQAENAAMAIQVYEDYSSNYDIIGIKKKLLSIEWPGRLEIISYQPTIILDACINRASAILVKEVINLIESKEVVTIVGVPKDKDYSGIIEEMNDISSRIIMTETSNPHYEFSIEQKELLTINKELVDYIPNLHDAISTAKSITKKNGLICILGTTSLITDVKKIIPHSV